MKKILGVLGLALAFGLSAPAQSTPEVTNVHVSQPALGVVEITYDLAQAACFVCVDVSKDGGATFPLAATTVSGDVGAGVEPGTGKQIVWRAFEDFNEEMPQAQVRVGVYLPEVTVAGIEFVLILPGTFQMGQVGVAEPVHQVTLTQPFYLSKYEVTQAQWEATMGSNPSYFQSPPDTRRPVEQVSWNDIQGFLSALNAANPGETFRLPTEAEWEYACRGGTTTERHYWGGDVTLGNYAWYSENSGSTTHPVGQKRPNPWGLYDMYGNVWEWVQDWYGGYSAEDQTDPTGPETGSSRVLRGGSWYYLDSYCRSANRYYIGPVNRHRSYGFRLLRTRN